MPELKVLPLQLLLYNQSVTQGSILILQGICFVNLVQVCPSFSASTPALFPYFLRRQFVCSSLCRQEVSIFGRHTSAKMDEVQISGLGMAQLYPLTHSQ